MRLAGYNGMYPGHNRPIPGGATVADSSFDIVSKGRPPGGRQRPQPGGKGTEHPLRLPAAPTPPSPGRARGHRNRLLHRGRAKPPWTSSGRSSSRRDISMKSLRRRRAAGLQQDRSAAPSNRASAARTPKKITKLIRDGPQGVKSQIQGEEIRSAQEARRSAGGHRDAQGADLDVAHGSSTTADLAHICGE